MQVSRNVATWAKGATGFECAGATDFSSGRIRHGAILLRKLLAPKRLACWAAEGIALLVIEHLARFLSHQVQNSPEAGNIRRGRDGLACPTHVLFNGGVMEADVLRTRRQEGRKRERT